METIKNAFLNDLKKIGIDKNNASEYFFSSRPETFFSDGQTIFFEDGYYHVIGTDRGEIVSEEIFENFFELNYYLLEYYVAIEAGQRVADKIGKQYHLYRKLFFEKQIELFNQIDSRYGKMKYEEIQKNFREEL